MFWNWISPNSALIKNVFMKTSYTGANGTQKFETDSFIKFRIL